MLMKIRAGAAKSSSDGYQEVVICHKPQTLAEGVGATILGCHQASGAPVAELSAPLGSEVRRLSLDHQ
ncbi:MAG: hypothetical protein M3N98_15300 [Actinomycetota bacterium]|nr:hypothetical protein [Actinomycetota bacterium]